jgi:hypothetical protein
MFLTKGKDGMNRRGLREYLVFSCVAVILSCSYDYLQPSSVPFTVSVTGPSAVYIHDTLIIRVSVPEPGVWGINYVWSVDSLYNADMTTDSVLKKVFSVKDTGIRRIVIKAIDGNGSESPEISHYINVRYRRPAVALHADTLAFIHTPYTLRFSGVAGDSRVAYYSWFIDDTLESRATTDTFVNMQWGVVDTGRRVIVVRAVDLDGIRSKPCSLTVNVRCHRPSIMISADTMAMINTRFSLTIRGSDSDSNITGFVWYIDDPHSGSTTLDTLITWTWDVADTGMHVIVARAVDRDSLWSVPCSLHVNVGCLRPTVTLYGDTFGFTGTLYTLRIFGTRGNSGIDRFVWYLDDSLASRTTVDTLFTWVWATGDTGRHFIAAYAVDRDGITSTKEKFSVTVLAGTPVITPFHDTAISSSDTLAITCHAADPNGTIDRFLWDFTGGGWDDSTADSSHFLWYGGNGTVRVTVGARDNDGLVSIAVFTVTFNRPPGSISVSAPVPVDTLVLPENTVTGTLAFTYSAADPDNETIVYFLMWRAEADTADSLVYQGTAQSYLLDGLCPGRYFWRLEARDPWGHARTANGTVIVIREHRVCFVGHSIVLGVGGDTASGGFRAGILDSLRKTLGPYERLKPVGPTTSIYYMRNSPADDSCMAVSGITGEILFNEMCVLPSLSADIWVLMTGVNDAYNPKGVRMTTQLMDLLYYRNTDSRIYVLNANPVSPTYWDAAYWLPSFNQAITDSIALRVAAGVHLFQVDGFTALSDSAGQYDPALFCTDGLHPNQTGYDRLRDAIFSTMKNSDPPVILSKP